MRCPSLKRLLVAFPELTAGKAQLIRVLCERADSPERLASVINGNCPATDAYVNSLYSDPYGSRMWRRTVVLHALNAIVGTYGVEGLGETSHAPYAPPYEYLNAGDTYATTLIYTRATDTLRIGAWGDIAERLS